MRSITVEAGSHVLDLLAQQQVDEVQSLFDGLTKAPEIPDSRKQLIQAVVAILNGSRDAALADDSALDYDDAAEVLFLIERLGSTPLTQCGSILGQPTGLQ
ncbi:hypothetical protein XM38_011060 [Halomicronema hongdechloris C2206]|uniref:Uncharacterized protein n=1 Tax=Halomicronema hongdechloris C2206 TaxID=1641165 RepID=A0A1Z3HIT8_9CYAN|nr:hypothetical protein [Halomicronema hongdechloris]ASC70176.1 hypothetical protein XM38_011060 [Halomicronema hongdechloris C2206]